MKTKQEVKLTHMPTPWAKSGNVIVGYQEREIIAQLKDTRGHNDAEANAAFIVRAVNAHQTLLEAAKEALCWLDPDCKLDGEKYKGEDYHSDKDKMVIGLYEAIAKAEASPRSVAQEASDKSSGGK